MKRIGNIFDQIWDIDNVRLAWSNHNANIKFWKRKPIDELKVKELSDQLKDLVFDFGPYIKHKLFGGVFSKDRFLHIPTFYSAVAQRAIFNIIEPILDKSVNTHSFCARKNFGGLKCAMKISRFVHTFKRKFCGRKNTRKKLYCLYFDIRKCYDNIHLETLYEIICGKIKDKNALSLIHKLIFSINTASNGFGLPIGNVGSHVFANLYLDSIYRRVSEIKKIKSVYVYMDNFTI
ncbi:MAG: reverse transcriptase domain-containing protein, partial [Bacteroidales bacterium]